MRTNQAYLNRRTDASAWLRARIVLTIVTILIGGCGESASSRRIVDKPPPSPKDYDSGAVELDYQKGKQNLYPQGELLTFIGRITDRLSSNDVIVDTKYDKDVGYGGDKVWATFGSSQSFAIGDTIRVSGRYLGTQRYYYFTRVYLEVPLVQADYATTVKNR